MNKIKAQIFQRSVEARRHSVNEMRACRDDHNPLLALAMIGVYKALSNSLTSAIGRSVKGEYIGAGHQQLVYDIGMNKLAKVQISTLGVSEDVASDISLSNQIKFDNTNDYLDPYWVETGFYPFRLPSYMGGHGVVGIQSNVRPFKRFDSPSDVLAHSTDEEYRSQIRDLTTKIDKLNYRTGMYPDLIGKGNIVLAENSTDLRIVDTLPVTSTELDELCPEGRTKREILGEIVASWATYSSATIVQNELPEVSASAE